MHGSNINIEEENALWLYFTEGVTTTLFGYSLKFSKHKDLPSTVLL